MTIYVNARFLTQQITGVQRYAIELSKRLKEIRPDIRFIAPYNIMHQDIAEYLGVEVTGRFTGHLWEQIELPLYLKNKKSPYLINLANLSPLLYNKTIFTIFDLSFIENPGWFSKYYYYFYRFTVPLLAKKAHLIITISEFSKKEIINYLKIPESKIKVIHCAPADFFLNESNINANMRGIPTTQSLQGQRSSSPFISPVELPAVPKTEFLGLPVNKYDDYIMALSSIDPRKNFTGLINSFNNISNKTIKLIIIGSINRVFRQNELKKNIDSNPNIIFTGYIPDNKLPDLFRNAKLFIYPSYYEGFGIPPLEAMACGCPTIVSNTSSLPEVCGDASYYINPYDVDDITKGINEVLTDNRLRNRLIQKGYKRIKHYSWNKSAEKISGIIDKL